MTVPILVEQIDGQFCASLAGRPELRCVRPSRDEAIAALQSKLTQNIVGSEMMNLVIPPLGVSGLAGQFKNDPELREIGEQIYGERDADRPE